MSIYIFCGPTLSADEGRRTLTATFFPPASHGDIYRATLAPHPPRIIGIIDGAFRTVPAVRHKEILWAMAEGIHVFGAASMGALRASELADFGMVGVGEIFQQYHSGKIEDDDEVAVDHGPAGLGYLPLNEALVDIRASLAASLRLRIITPEVHDRLVALAKGMFYRQRSYESLLQEARLVGLQVDGLAEWLPTGRVSQKKEDGGALLRRIRDFAASDPPKFMAPFRFEHTEAWEDDRVAATAGSNLASAGLHFAGR